MKDLTKKIITIAETPIEKLYETAPFDIVKEFADISKRKIVTVKDAVLCVMELYEGLENGTIPPGDWPFFQYVNPFLHSLSYYIQANEYSLDISDIKLVDYISFCEEYIFTDDVNNSFYIKDYILEYYGYSDCKPDFDKLTIHDFISAYNCLKNDCVSADIYGLSIEETAILDRKEFLLSSIINFIFIKVIGNIYDCSGKLLPAIANLI